MPNVVPIFDEEMSFIGIWSWNKDFQPSYGRLAELMGLCEPTLRALEKLPTRRVLVQDRTRVGPKVVFESGVFIMVNDEKAPSEEYIGPESKKMLCGYQRQLNSSR